MLSVFGLEPKRIGGTEMYARELSRQLGEAGWKSCLCFEGAPAPAVARFLEAPNTSICVLPGISNPNAGVLRRFADLLRERPEIVHLSYTPLLSLYPLVARMLRVRKVFMTDQGSYPEGYRPSRAALWKRLVAAPGALCYTMVICNSDHNARCAATRGYVAPSRICRIYNGVDMDRRIGSGAEFRRRHGIPLQAPVVLQASWIRPEKGIEDFLEAARIVLAERPDAHFVLVGEGAAQPAMMQRAEALGIARSVAWTGLVEDPLAEGVFTAADVVCQLSRWEEAFGWVIAEAMVCKRPVVATRVGGIPELVEDGRTGYLVPRRDPRAAAARILTLIADPELRAVFGHAARESAREKFELRKNVAEVLRLYGIGAPAVPQRAVAAAVGERS
ncbi:MAG: glycosyltransferase family 4 protein [bacterium]